MVTNVGERERGMVNLLRELNRGDQTTRYGDGNK